eukprot:10384238-Lingulodinium_polyedra.AAC.1
MENPHSSWIWAFPMAGASERTARRGGSTLECVLCMSIARRPAACARGAACARTRADRACSSKARMRMECSSRHEPSPTHVLGVLGSLLRSAMQ